MEACEGVSERQRLTLDSWLEVGTRDVRECYGRSGTGGGGKGMTHVNVPGRRQARMAIIVIWVLSVFSLRPWHDFNVAKGLSHVMLSVRVISCERSRDG